MNDLHKEFRIGRVTLVIRTRDDDDPDLSHLGTVCNFTEPHSGQKLVHCASQSVTTDGRIWRDERGRIVPTPEWGNNWREYEFVLCDNGQTCHYALEDANRLRRYGDWWSCIGIIAEVYFDGALIGNSSCWGLETDSEEKYLRDEAKSIARDALFEARNWRDRNLVAA